MWIWKYTIFPLLNFFFINYINSSLKSLSPFLLCLRCFSLSLILSAPFWRNRSEFHSIALQCLWRIGSVVARKKPVRSLADRLRDPDTRPNIEGKHIDLERNVALLFARSFRNRYRSTIIWQKLLLSFIDYFVVKWWWMENVAGLFSIRLYICLRECRVYRNIWISMSKWAMWRMSVWHRFV